MYSLYVALVPPPGLQAVLAVPSGVPPSDIRMTLAWFGGESSYSKQSLASLPLALATFAAAQPPLAGRIASPGRFTRSTSPRGHDVLWRGVEIDGLDALRERLLQAIAPLGFAAVNGLPFVPHLTLAYLAPGTQFEFSPPALPWSPAALTLVSGRRSPSFPFSPPPPVETHA